MAVDLVHVSYDTGVAEPVPVGRLRFVDRRCYFQFDAQWRARSIELSPMQLRLTDAVVEGPPPTRSDGLHSLFNDSLPDGWGRLLIDKAVRRSGVNPATLTPIDRLSLVGVRGMGALTYLPDAGAALIGMDDVQVDLEQIAAQAERIYEGSLEDVLPELLRDGGSPMGARPKALLTISKNGRSVRSGSLPVPAGFVPTLVKFPAGVDGADAALVEEAYARMARTAGIDMPPTRVITTRDKRRCFAVARFDRRGSERIHMQTLGAMIDADPADAVDYDTYLACTLRVTRDHRAVVEAFRRAAFNVIAHNRDDHVRNFAYLMEPDGTWVLAPAYDLTFNEGRFGRHALSCGGEDMSVTVAHLRHLARDANISDTDASDIITRVDAAVADWAALATQVGMPAQRRRAIARALDDTRKVVFGSGGRVATRAGSEARIADASTRALPGGPVKRRPSRKRKR
jgi:serine/threonine-protein kinase HipA